MLRLHTTRVGNAWHTHASTASPHWWHNHTHNHVHRTPTPLASCHSAQHTLADCMHTVTQVPCVHNTAASRVCAHSYYVYT